MAMKFGKKTYSKGMFRPKYVFRSFSVLLIELLCTESFLLIWMAFTKDNNQTGHLTGLGNIFMALGIYISVLTFMMYEFKGYKIGVNRKINVIASQIASICITGILEIFISMAITGEFRFFGDFLTIYGLMIIIQSFITFLLSSILINIYRYTFPPLKIVEIYQDKNKIFMNKMNTRYDKYNVCRTVYINENFSEIKSIIADYDAVLINDIDSKAKNEILKICYDYNKRIYYNPKISDIIIKHSEDINLFDTPLMMSRNVGFSFTQLFIKRFFDILFSLMGLIILSPVFIVVGFAIKKEDGGPVFYMQERYTLNNNVFKIIKFRSMKVDSDKVDNFRPAGENDDRITKVGKIIRATRIDELPQLINIFKGDMSLVGPRPEILRNVEKYSEDIKEFTFRSKIKAGLTGYAQVYGKYNTSALDKLKMDFIYITNYSILLDIQIIFETIKVVFQKESTEGFSEEKQKEMTSYEGFKSK